VNKTEARARDDRRVEAAASKVHVDGSVGFGEGSKGRSVSIVQRHLRAAGFDPKHTNGVFDERTAGMVKELQRKSGLPATGRVDERTWNALKSSTIEAKNNNPTSPHQSVGERSSAVKNTERMLKDLGFKTGKVDGLYTENTQKAVDAFRRKKGLGGVGDGVGPGTLRSIRKAWKAKQAANTNTVKGCAQFLLKSKNVSFWTGLSTGSDRKNVERLARGEKAFVPATGQYIKPNLRVMQALVDMAKHGPIMINALTGGIHSPNSNHYRGIAVDLDVNVGNTAEIERIARRHGGLRNFERDHIHLDF
jgi:peptidoglycan hydrolase-like protein with peptidoglycan-binding domain